jgi:hypothetical protein
MKARSPLLCVGVPAILVGCAWDSSQITYEDRNGDGRIDHEYHAFAGRDCNWELVDTDFNGRYDRKIAHGFSRQETLIDQPVPRRRRNSQ